MATTAPVITFAPTSPTGVQILKDVFSVYLYAEQALFDEYAAWGTAIGTTANTFEKNAAETYSGYVLRFDCNISAADVTTKNGSGCCLRDNTGQSEDGYCLLQYEDATQGNLKTAQTYYLTNSQFTQALQDPYEIAEGLRVVQTESNIPGFQRFLCETFTADTSFVCDKF